MVSGKVEHGFDPAIGKGENIRRPGGCSNCQTYPRDKSPPDCLRVTVEYDDPVTFTGWGFGVVSDEFLHEIGQDAANCLMLGTLADSSGKQVDKYRTFLGRERLVLRGNQSSEHSICGTCGAIVYTYLPRESPYLTAAQVASSRQIYEGESMQLIVCDSVLSRLSSHLVAALDVFPLPILPHSVDGLADDIALWPTPEQSQHYSPNPSRFGSRYR